MALITETPPAAIREELTRLRRQLGRDIPKKTDRNLLIATWNLREFGDLTRKWDSTQADTPKRDLHALACIKEVVKRFDVVAIQEAQKSLGALREQGISVRSPSATANSLPAKLSTQTKNPSASAWSWSASVVLSVGCH